MAEHLLLTGGAGYIGSHAALHFLENGYSVTIADDFRTGYRENIPEGAICREGDIGDTAFLERLFKEEAFDGVCHFAASTSVPESMTDPLGTYANNTLATIQLARAAAAGRVRCFLFSSSAAVYGLCGDGAVSEETEPAPLSPYGRSKLFSEWAIEATANSAPMRAASLRYFNVAGADPAGRTGDRRENAQHLIKAVCEVISGKRERLEVFGTDYPTPDGTGVRDYIHVSDLASAHGAVMRLLLDGDSPGVINIGYGAGYSVLDVIRAAELVCGHPIPLHHAARRAGDTPSAVADNRRLLALTDWQPRYNDLHDIIRHALAWENGQT